MSTETQCKRLLDYMRGGGKVTSLDALSEFGIARLASRVSDLRKRGYPVMSEWVEVENRFGERVRVKRYWMEEDSEKG